MRNLGLPGDVKGNGQDIQMQLYRHQGDILRPQGPASGARIIVVYWCFLIAVGFLCSFAAVYSGCWAWFHPTTQYHHSDNIVCTPSSGQLDTSMAYHNISCVQGEERSVFILSDEFLRENHCTNPCTAPSIRTTIFRDGSELQIVTFAQVDFLYTWEGYKNTTLRTNKRHIEVVRFSYQYVWRFVPLILAQGTWAIIFGRRSPSEARSLLYTVIRDMNAFGLRREPWNKQIAFWFAISTYLAALLILLICPTLFLLAILVAELFLRHLPQSDSANNIGAWGPFVSTTLVLLAALIARYHHKVTDDILRHPVGRSMSIVRSFFETVQVYWYQLNDTGCSTSYTFRTLIWPDSRIATCLHPFLAVGYYLISIEFHFIHQALASTLSTIRGALQPLTQQTIGEWKELREVCRDPEYMRNSLS